MRGALIFPFMLELFRLDRASTSGDPDGVGAATSGFDPDFREPVLLPTDDGLGASARQESGPLLIPVQVEPASFERLEMIRQGDNSVSAIDFVAHFQDLEAEGLVDESGRPTVAKGDRVSRILTMEGEVETNFPNPPGLYVTEARPIGYGIGGRKNLLLISCDSRKQG